jgi:glycosyltransferase involved in cell wall biosynthesis
MKISESTFTIEANGFADGPAQPLRDYLLKHNAARVVFINHPLVKEGSREHIVTIYENGKKQVKKYPLPNWPPYTFALDTFVPIKTLPTDAWFAFNNLAALKALSKRKIGKAKHVYYWAVDFVPNRFGSSPLTKIYNKIDKTVCLKVDARIELSESALEGRNKFLELNQNASNVPTLIVPMGTWLDRTPKVKEVAWERQNIIYMGHLVERQGVEILIRACKILKEHNNKLTLDIVGGGPLLEKLIRLAKDQKIDDIVKFHGFVKDYKNVESILAKGTVAAAPYKVNSWCLSTNSTNRGAAECERTSAKRGSNNCLRYT